ncbi:MAG: aminopeptidase [Treponema sp.]|nr:aminopeptidase [Treponema sp.]
MGLFSKKEKSPSQTVVQDVLKAKKGERALIIANPETTVIAQELYTAFIEAGARPTLVFQQRKSSMDYAEEAVIGALKSEPEMVLSISAGKLGKDREAMEKPYVMENSDAGGQSFDSAFDYLLSGKKSIRAVWTPGLDEDMFNRTVNIDYKALGERCRTVCKLFEGAVSVHVISPAGTDITIGVGGRKALVDNGDFSLPGSGGNIPAGEVFVSPVVGSAEGKIVFDGSMTFADGDAMLSAPLEVEVKAGFVGSIKGGAEADRLLKDITAAENEAAALVTKKKFSEEQGAAYRKNARNIGELGIGLNPAASVTGNMLEDEKAFRTCHFAIGENYDGDAPALIHFDGIVRAPTVTLSYGDGSSRVILEAGELRL